MRAGEGGAAGMADANGSHGGRLAARWGAGSGGCEDADLGGEKWEGS